jgi:glycosyltransferase involved in cell wall biosynthesis
VVGIKAMAMTETLVHGETAFLAGVAQENLIGETILGEESGFQPGHRIVFENFRTADYRASVYDIAEFLEKLMSDSGLRGQMGVSGRARAVEHYDYRVVAKRFIDTVTTQLGIS